ncbi:MAG: orotidine-5'-phosphate decarboxylase [Cryomorphaceae bacterium]|nr:orotidine-5'-phosphate decarboxylase [Flavobacteriales bacterium]
MNRRRLIEIIKEKGSFLCVGLDPDPAKMPEGFEGADGILAFNRAIIDATRPFAAAYKPNIAFYEALGPKGWEVLGATLDYIGEGHFTIADAKRGDIGNTSRMYAQTFFETYAFDSVTVAPYMGSDSVQPFLSFPEKWVVILALTSNAGADDFQFIEDGNSSPVYESVLRKAAAWGTSDNTMFVVGATRPEMFEGIRKIVPDHFLLVPGVGAQGGSLSEVCRYGLNSDVGLLVNASRSILYASRESDFAEAARAVAESIAMEMNKILQK